LPSQLAACCLLRSLSPAPKPQPLAPVFPGRLFGQQLLELLDKRGLVAVGVGLIEEAIDSLAIEPLPELLFLPRVDGEEKGAIGARGEVSGAGALLILMVPQQ